MPPRLLLALSLFVALAASLFGQPATLPHARLWSLAPCGGQAGTSVRVLLRGADLEEATSLWFSHPDLRATPVAGADPKLGPQFDVVIPPGTPPGRYDVRVVGRYGRTNPRVFVVGTLPEAGEKEPNNDVPEAQPLLLDTTVQGVISQPTDVDYFRIDGNAGQRISVQVASETIDSRLDPEVVLLSSQGRRLAQSWRFQGREACLSVTLPAAGSYLLRLCQHAHQAGDADYFYRLTVSTRPIALAVLPTEQGIRLLHTHSAEKSPEDPWNLAPPSPVESTGPGPLPARTLGLALRPWRSVDFLGTPLLPRLEGAVHWVDGTNRSPETAMPISPGVALVGPLRTPMLWFRLPAKKGQPLVLEAFGDRWGAEVDLFLEVRRADNGTVLGEFDDPAEPLAVHRFFARTDDPRVTVNPVADGDLLIGLGNRLASPRLASRQFFGFRVRPPEPDFRLAAVDVHPQSPGTLQLARGSHRAVEVHVQRLEGFSGKIMVRAEGLPAGVTALAQPIAPGRNSILFVFSTAPDAPAWNGTFRLVGTAEIGGKLVEREVLPACQVWPNPAEGGGVPTAVRLCAGLHGAVREAPPLRLHCDVDTIAVPVGGSVVLPLEIKREVAEAQVAASVVLLPSLPGVAVNGNNNPIAVPLGVARVQPTVAVAGNVPPGEYHLLFAAVANVPFAKGEKERKNPVLVAEGCRPIRVVVFAPPAAVPPGGKP